MTGLEYTIQTYELCKKYGDCSVVRNVSMHVPKGQIYGLLGRNGAGKTTIMKMVLGLVRKDSGSVTLFNQVMTGYQSGIYARIGSLFPSVLRKRRDFPLLSDLNKNREIHCIGNCQPLFQFVCRR